MQEQVGGGAGNGATGDESRERMERLRARATQAGADARERARVAAEWARSRYGAVNQTVGANPRTAALIALGVGVLIGVLLGRGRERDELSRSLR